ncbi:MAG: amidase [Actinobacteria bacterium]|nr:amidase [Actinomycetota bacterium]
MTTFLLRLDPNPTAVGPRLAVKDLIDVAGTPTTYGSRALVAAGPGATVVDVDAACLAGARAAGARLVGKTNLHELAFGGRGVNPHFGTPRNPIDPTRIPGGSSSGSAVAVADGDADVAFGSDTGGSVRIPAACCGVVGLKTTHGRIPLEGCRPLAPVFDTVGPLGRDVAAVALGMALLEPGFVPSSAAALPDVVGIPRQGPDTDPGITAAVEDAIRAAGWRTVPVDLPGWDAADRAATVVSAATAYRHWSWLLDSHGDLIGADVRGRLAAGAAIDADEVERARAVLVAWRAELRAVFRTTPLLAMPTLAVVPPPIDEEVAAPVLTGWTRAANASGTPAISLPVPRRGGGFPASLQFLADDGAEDVLLTAAARVEAAVA